MAQVVETQLIIVSDPIPTPNWATPCFETNTFLNIWFSNMVHISLHI